MIQYPFNLPSRSSPVVDSWAHIFHWLLRRFDENRAKTLRCNYLSVCFCLCYPVFNFSYADMNTQIEIVIFSGCGSMRFWCPCGSAHPYLSSFDVDAVILNQMPIFLAFSGTIQEIDVCFAKTLKNIDVF